MYGSSPAKTLADLGLALGRVAKTLPKERERALELLTFVDQALGPA
jgi:hypothetical protein